MTLHYLLHIANHWDISLIDENKKDQNHKAEYKKEKSIVELLITSAEDARYNESSTVECVNDWLIDKFNGG